MSKALLYATSNENQDITVAGNFVHFNAVERKFGCIRLNGNQSVYMPESGYYLVLVRITASAATAGTMNVTVRNKGTDVPGSSVDVRLFADSVPSTFTIPCVVRHNCPCNPSNISVFAKGVASTISSASITVIKE